MRLLLLWMADSVARFEGNLGEVTVAGFSATGKDADSLSLSVSILSSSLFSLLRLFCCFRLLLGLL